MKIPLILVTNDDGIDSPGLWAAAVQLESLGQIEVVAPREQATSAGRSMPLGSDGIIESYEINIAGALRKGYAVGGSPAQAVLHALLEILPRRPDLVVSGINFGENIGTGVTISGTVGAAIEAAAAGIPALAISLETDIAFHLTLSKQVDFSTAAFFTKFFASKILENTLPFDVDILKIEVPVKANPNTPWEVTHLSRKRYYESRAPKRLSWLDSGKPDYIKNNHLKNFPPSSDAYVLAVKQQVSVTPLSIDLTSRVSLTDIDKLLRE